MHFINPFKGLRPVAEKASSVCIPSTDHLSPKKIINHKKNNPWSYLNIFNPDHQNSNSQNEIEDKLSEELLSGNLKEGDKAVMSIKDGALIVKVRSPLVTTSS